MNTVEKNKNLFIVTLDNGKQTYFDFADNTFHGISGRVVNGFNRDAMKILSSKSKNFLACYFTERKQSWSNFRWVRLWQPAMVETIYSLFSQQYSVAVLKNIAEFCYFYNYVLDKKGVRILKEALHSLENKNGHIDHYFSYQKLHNIVNTILYQDYPEDIINLLDNVTNKIEKIITEDIEKISFRYEHENWNFFESYSNKANFLACCLTNYIELCELFHKERTYKNLFLSICLMEKEKELMSEEICANYQKDAPLFFENDNFTIIIPTTAKEFQAEADYQHNCVFRIYYPRVKDMETHIVFIRKKDNKRTPYITCEINNNGKIIQCLKKYNETITSDKDLNFLRDYQAFLDNNF